MPLNPAVISHELNQFFGPPPSGYVMTRDEVRIFGVLKSILMEAKSGDVEAEEEEIPYQTDEAVDDEDWNAEDEEARDIVKSCQGQIKFSTRSVSIQQAQLAVDYMRKPKQGCRPLDSMRKTHRFIQTEHDMRVLRNFEEEVNGRKSRIERLSQLKDMLASQVFQKFDEGVSLHDQDLRRLALKINEEHKFLDNFVASATWVTRFKRYAGITSRRVTTFTSTKTLKDKEKIAAAANKFVSDLHDEMNNSPNKVFINCDQSGVNKEIHCLRTLAKMGERTVIRMAQSTSSMTHSYTVLPLHYSSGKLGTKLFVQLAEPKGVFPAKGYFQTHNLVVVAGTTHIMSKKSMCQWIQECVITEPHVEIVLVLDSWTSFRDVNLIQSLALPGQSLEVRTIPAGATSICQPLDLYFFRFFKNTIRQFHHHVSTNDIPFNLHARDNILKVLSLIYRIFSHVKYTDFLKHAWISGGYIDKPNKTARFSTPCDDIFIQDSGRGCSVRGCSVTMAFVECAYCSKDFCFLHFVDSYHWC